jgi:hypothetical protein
MTGTLGGRSAEDHNWAFGHLNRNATNEVTFTFRLSYDSTEANGDRIAVYHGTGSVNWHTWGTRTWPDRECKWDESGTAQLAGDSEVIWTYDGPNKGKVTIAVSYGVTYDGPADCPLDGSNGWSWSDQGEASGSQTASDGEGTVTDTWSISASTQGRPCRGSEGRIDSVWTPSGNGHGLAGTRLTMGQTITAAEDTELRFGDGSKMRLRKGTRLKIAECPTAIEHDFHWYFNMVLGTSWHTVSKVFGSEHPEWETEHCVIGNRGTVFRFSYDPRRQLTTVHVTQGSVWMRNVRGARRRTVIINAGQTGTQQGNGPPVLHRH